MTSKNIEKYFKNLRKKSDEVYDVAQKARKQGFDPSEEVEVPRADSLAGKVAGLIATLYPQLKNEKFINRILELEKEYGSLDPAVCLAIAEEVAKEKFCKFKSLEEGIDAGIRVALAYTTLGVVSSPIEGFTEVKIQKTEKGGNYFCPFYSGPIRSAGGTAAAFSLVIIDYLREIFGYDRYDPTEKEVKRCVTEIYDYHERVTNLQYLPSEKEAEFLAKNLPVQISGEPSTKREVSNYKDLSRVETNFIRSGFCLVLGEGIAQKAPKILRKVNDLKSKGFKLNSWDWLEEFVEIQKKAKKGEGSGGTATYIKDLVAGRPVMGHPSRSGGFRLRYGRARNTGFSCLAIHPATMAITGGFIATGSQVKIELPTKGAAMAPCDTIDGPIVKLKNGSVRKIKTREEGERNYDSIEEIIYLGDMLIPYGDFVNRNHKLMPPGFTEQEWYQFLKSKIKEEGESLEIENIYEVELEKAKDLSKKFKIPLHPKFIFFWREISYDLFLSFLDWLEHSKFDKKIILPYNRTEKERFQKGKRALELLGIQHEVVTENVLIDIQDSKALIKNLSLSEDNFVQRVQYAIQKIKKFREKEEKNVEKMDVLKVVNHLSDFKIMDKSGTFIGSRMGRPEKAKLRKLQGAPNVLFPVGEEGGRMRSVSEAYKTEGVNSDFPIYYCKNCDQETIYKRCEVCEKETKRMYYCYKCKEQMFMKECPKHETKNNFHRYKKLPIKRYFDEGVKKLGLLPSDIPQLIKGVKGTSNKEHIPENLTKGILRALFDLQVNKDGTIRIDATELPITHFKPREIGTSVAKLREIGYEKDIFGNDLENEEQILEIKPHDVILPSCPDSGQEGADEIFLRTANFIDLMLSRFYGMQPYYNVRSREDLVGHLMAGIAPHNCAGVVARIIGFSKTQSLLASPYIHAACRRDCLSYGNYVPVKKEGRWQINKIGKFIEKENPKEKADNFGTLKKEVSSETFSNPGVAEIKEVTKHEPRKLLKIFLEDGREIKLTENHKVYLKGKEMKRAKDLKIGDKLTVSYKKDVGEKDIKEIFLPEIFKDREDVMIRNINSFLKSFSEVDKSSNFFQRDSYPIKKVCKILKDNNKTLEDLPSETKIAIKGDNVSIPLRISLNKDFLEIIGLYIAEGFTRKNVSKKGFYQVSIAGNEEIKEKIKKVFKSHFNLKPSEDHEDHVTFSSRIIYEIFNSYLDMGSRAKEKRIPSLFLDLKKEKIAALLRGYFEGDGSVSITDRRVTCDSVSEGLKYDLSFVLSRFGIFTKFYKYKKKPGPIVKDFYLKKNREVPEFEITKIIIPCDFVSKFDQIGFISKRKNKILSELVKREGKGMKIDFDKKYVYPKVKAIEEKEEEKSFCFNVDGDHNFFANDILVKNCDGDEIAVMMLLDLLINFSKKYLPAHRGGTQDAPLVLNMRIRAGEVDDMIFDFDVQRELDLDFYKAARKMKMPSEVKVEQISDRIGKGEFENLWYEYEVSDINSGVLCSTYKKLNTMQEKVQKQMELAEKCRPAETSDVARLIIDRHFIRDIRGNLRKFSQQEFRCSKCNKKFRRPPLRGICDRCNGNVIFTIHEGSIVKYLEPAIQLAEKYKIPEYVNQSLQLTKRYIESIFGKDKEKQEGLQKWF